uniref:Uncharacterized protein n=1 Tax=Amphimedon queenslandica TaxID=400682 RepID=A0A1X7U526_AMPQE
MSNDTDLDTVPDKDMETVPELEVIEVALDDKTPDEYTVIVHPFKAGSDPNKKANSTQYNIKAWLLGKTSFISLWWVEDAPDIKTVEGGRKAPGFIDNHISRHVPKDGEDDDSKDLVSQLQKHNHTLTCRKNGCNCCCFDYPKRPSDTTRLKRNADVGNKACFYIL